MNSAAALSSTLLTRVHIPHFLRCTVTATIGLSADFVWLQVRRTPLTGRRRYTARTVQDPPCGAVRGERDQIRSVAIRAGTWQISSPAFRTLDAMTNTKHEEKARSDRNQLLRMLFFRLTISLMGWSFAPKNRRTVNVTLNDAPH